jgi:hypothetical protein
LGRDFACPKVKKTKKKEKKTLMNLKKKNSKRDLPPHRHLLVILSRNLDIGIDAQTAD